MALAKAIKLALRVAAYNAGIGYRVEVARQCGSVQDWQVQIRYCYSWQAALDWKAAMLGYGWRSAIISIEGCGEVYSQVLKAGE